MTTKQSIEYVPSGRRKPMRVPAIITDAAPLSTQGYAISGPATR